MSETETTPTISAEPPFRYNATLANEIELKWQAEWEKANAYYTPNPSGELANINPEFNHHAENKPKMFVMDMFPYPSGAGLHVGHPLGFIATDVYSRFKRMTGFNVLYTMGMDAFGLPAEQYAIATNTHPRITTETNITNMNRQLSRIGLSHDKRRAVSTIDPDYFKWTQTIFLLIYNSYMDEKTGEAASIENLIAEFEAGTRNVDGKTFNDLSKKEKADAIDQYRLAYLADSVVNWCPGLGTVLANEEVTADGKSERGNFDVFKRPMKQWMMRITAYADRLIDDLDFIDWPESLKIMQRNWIGKSKGAILKFDIKDSNDAIEVFTTRADTIYSAAFLVLAPENPLVEQVTTAEQKQAVDQYIKESAAKNDIERTAEDKEKTGVFTGAYAINPANDEEIPVWIGDFVLANYGTGAVFGDIHDERDFEFLNKFNIPAKVTVIPDDEEEAKKVLAKEYPFTGYGTLIESGEFTGMKSEEAKEKIVAWLETKNHAKETINYRLRDWLFSRQRYWGEPFPIVYDEDGIAHDIPTSMLPLELPTLENFAPESSDDPDAKPKPPLGRVEDWVNVELDLGRGDGLQKYTRETNTMPNWAGSCWYYLRYCDPENDNAIIDPAIEKYWSGDKGEKSGMVDLYVGGVEHAVLHLLYARFWHKVLFDRGVVSTLEPFGKLFNQGMIQAFAYTDERGFYVDAAKVVERDGKYFYEDKEVNREFGKMGKSLKNIVTPDEMCETYGADTLRLYEMFMGPLDMSRPWSTADVSGVYRFLQRIWRNIVDEETGELKISEEAVPEELLVIFNKTIAGVKDDYDSMSYNVAIAKMFELNNALTKYVTDGNNCPRIIAQTFALLLSPLAPHFASELYEKLGNKDSILYADFPIADEKYLVDDTIEIPVQINGKVRSKIVVASDADSELIEKLARENETIAAQLEGKTVIKAIVVPGRMCNFVVKPA